MSKARAEAPGRSSGRTPLVAGGAQPLEGVDERRRRSARRRRRWVRAVLIVMLLFAGAQWVGQVTLASLVGPPWWLFLFNFAWKSAEVFLAAAGLYQLDRRPLAFVFALAVLRTVELAVRLVLGEDLVICAMALGVALFLWWGVALALPLSRGLRETPDLLAPAPRRHRR